ncbi:uncharacterized protein MYCFIDRAFT_186849 [Pseudocercospora fijiensis CIRAD86]|uniref:AB hydrolase-1 domain-containing protein n=1 Tax=Pseudocercospora fijiensis (strain CIRAD86) TaxID=383855 RepID=M3BBX2_PSEFD|nr:uncharacterized protein MYCFIDRAFT_186849 [Pseudocercospora fijiensis CIRAD86]EME86757.1 hypothetical protein MYCFIDRAFT_186849 [Pseudocercospora fijiensis CIRAD86]
MNTAAGYPATRADAGAAFEAAQHADNSFAFYNTPSNFSQSTLPGTLLLVEDATPMLNYTVPISLTLSRIIYTTSDINGTVLPTTAYVLWPYTAPDPVKGFDIVSWAHGTSGVFRTCAPSNYRSLQYHFMVPYTLALQGFVVVAPDYAGLGIDTLPSGQHFRHQWVTGPAQANDVANAIGAARKAFPQVLQPNGSFVVMGHSQGGRAAWAFAEQQAALPLEGYRGTVALAPPVKVVEQVQRAIANTSEVYAPGTLAQQVMIIDAISTVFPSYNYSGLTGTAYARWVEQVARLQGCLPTNVLAFLDLEQDQLVHSGWTNSPIVQEWAKIFEGPLLVIAGDIDAAVDFQLVKTVAEETCAQGQRKGWHQSLKLVQYSAVSHFAVIQASQQEWLGWIQNRFRDQDGEIPGCISRRVDGYRAVPSSLGTAPNFFLRWFDPVVDFWKYIL